MIKNKEDYYTYLAKDAEASQVKSLKTFSLLHGEIYKLQHSLRFLEYCNNTFSRIKGLFFSPIILFHKVRYHVLSNRLKISIPLNVVGPGLCIVHGNVLINPKCQIGRYARIMGNVTIGVSHYNSGCPRIGDFVFLGDGCKVLGDCTVVDKVAIGANSVVIRDLNEMGCYAGIPAKKISDKNSGFQYCDKMRVVIDNSFEER